MSTVLSYSIIQQSEPEQKGHKPALSEPVCNNTLSLPTPIPK